MVSVNMRELLDAGVHFGHQTQRWNPKMKPYIMTSRNGIYIVDLRQTAVAFREALDFLRDLAGSDGNVLFVGTKRQAQDAVRDAAESTGMFFVNQRWLGGLLTNFETIRKSVARLKDLESMEDDGRMDLLPKKEVIKLRRQKFKLFRNLEGIKEMTRIPDAVFVLDVRRERIAIREAMNLGIPIVAIVDTNCDPEGIDFVVPGNDDALRSIRLFLGSAGDAIREGKQIREKAIEEAALQAAREAEAAAAEEAAAKAKKSRSGKAAAAAEEADETAQEANTDAAAGASKADAPADEPKAEAAPEPPSEAVAEKADAAVDEEKAEVDEAADSGAEETDAAETKSAAGEDEAVENADDEAQGAAPVDAGDDASADVAEEADEAEEAKE